MNLKKKKKLRSSLRTYQFVWLQLFYMILFLY